jgi:transcriptional regulator with XRE-family HTH domain
MAKWGFRPAWVKALREARGVSQAALAARAGLTREYVNKLEAGKYDPTLSTLGVLAKALGVTERAFLDARGG